MSDLSSVLKLSIATAAGFRGEGGSLTLGSGGGKRHGHRLTWELIAGALANPRGRRPADKRLPVEELARALVLGELNRAGYERLLTWVCATDRLAAETALLAVIHARVCGNCKGLGSTHGGTRECGQCGGAGVKYLGERETARRLGVTRHQYRERHRATHKELIAKIMGLYLELELRLRGA